MRPPPAGPSADAFSTLVSDASFVCPGVQLDSWTARRAPAYAYTFNDDTAPQLFAPPGFIAQVATHASELQYLLDMPNVPYPTPLNADQQALAATVRSAWSNFIASGTPTTTAVPWPAFRATRQAPVLTLDLPRPQLDNTFSTTHHCSFWAAG